jgi:hypothetical protein
MFDGKWNFSGSHYLFPKKNSAGFSEAWTKGAITLFMIIVILGYVTSIYLLIRVSFVESRELITPKEKEKTDEIRIYI